MMDAILEAKELCFAYPGGRPVFEKLSLQVRPGETLCILGPNGAGKTTLLNCLANLSAPAGGAVCLNGRDIRTMPGRETARLVGYVPQMILPSFDFSVLDYVVTGCAPRMGTFEKPRQQHYETAMAAIREMGIEALADKSCLHISGGERQQAAIARALAQQPKFILMDEPTAHLDYGNQIKVLRTIRRLALQGFGVVFTTHSPDHALLLGGRTAVLDRQGTLQCGPSEEILTEALLTELYRTPLKLPQVNEVGRRICASPGLEEMDF